MARHGFSTVELTARFKKSFRALSAERRLQCMAALEQMYEDPLPNGLRYKPIRPANVYFEARINSGDRLVILPSGNTATVMDVVTHDDIQRWSKA